MFGTFLTVIIAGYVVYYGYQLVNDLFLKKEAKVATKAEEEDVDISEDVAGFESELVERTAHKPAAQEDDADSAKVVNTGGIEVGDLMKHIDAFAQGEDFGELRNMMADWEIAPAA